MLLIILALITNCNKSMNLKKIYKFDLTNLQKEKIREGDIESLKSFMDYYGNKKSERSCESEVPLLYIIKHFNSSHSSQKEKNEDLILEHIRPYIDESVSTKYDSQGNTALHYCIEKNYFNIAKAFLNEKGKFKTDIQAIRNNEKENPLYLAIEHEKLNFVELFIEHMEDINRPFKYVLTPLTYAALLGKSDIVKLLIDKGAVIKDVTQLRMITISNLERKLKEKLAEEFISSIKDEDEFKSILWVFNGSKANNFNLTLDHINEEINPKKSFKHVADEEVESYKREIKSIFRKYQSLKTKSEKNSLKNKVNDNESKNLSKNNKVFSKLFKKLKIK